MNEWVSVMHDNFHTKHSVLTAPDEHMPHIIQLHIMSIRWIYYEQMKQQNMYTTFNKKKKKKKKKKIRQTWFKKIRPNLTKGYSQIYICADYVWKKDEKYTI